MKSYGSTTAYVAGGDRRDLPAEPPPYRPHPPRATRATGLDWAKHTAPEPVAVPEPTPKPASKPQVRRKRPSRPASPRPQARKPRTLSVDETAVVEAYMAGSTVPQLAEQHRTRPATIRRALQRRNVPMRDDRKGRSGGRNKVDLTAPDVAEPVCRLYMQGSNIRDIARKTRHSQRVVAEILRANGVEVRQPANVKRGAA